MKNIVLIFLISLSFESYAQNTGKDLFTTKNIVWYGLNFAEAKMVGLFDQAAGAGAASPGEIRDKWIPAWNVLIVNEPDHYKIKEAFRKNEVYFDLSPTEKMNHEIKLDNFVSYNAFNFSDPNKTVQDVVSALKGGDKNEGIGLVFVVESFNKTSDEASIYVTVFDIKTKKVLITEKIIGKPAGFGLRNFWGGAIKRILKQISDVNYSYWKSKEK